MDSTRNGKTKRIAFLLLCSVLLPVAGYYIAADIEDTQNSPSGGALAWAVLTTCGLATLFFAHFIAKKHYQFRALGLVAVLASLTFMAAFGWIANGAWYNYYFFSDYIRPKFSVHQDSEHPNQFLFNGEFEKGSANAVIRKILSSEDLDWERPIALELHSDGGMPQEAIILSEFVKHYSVHVEVIGKCNSACTLVLLASQKRYVHPRAWIGFHATYLKLPDGPDYGARHLRFYDELLESELARVGTSNDFKERSKVQDSESGFEPTYEELVNEGIVNEFHRLYLSETQAPFYL